MTGPIRTCVGCRRRDAQAALLRVVAGPDSFERSERWVILPDPHRRSPGRGAYVHPTSECCRVAIERRAFGRALRRQGQPEVDALRAWVATAEQRTAQQERDET